MTLAILHLSDIHIKEATDAILNRSKEIAACLNSYLPSATTLVILISGDIAQAGQSSEYDIAAKFVSELKSSILLEKKLPIEVLVSPGNHDCDFSGDQEARQAIISAIPKRTGVIPESFVAMGTSVQANFIKFRRQISNGALVHFDNPLWVSYLLEVEGAKVIFDLPNASWMSIRHEQQGGLLFPFEQFSDIKQSDADLRILTFHHPFNWYSQSNYLPFRSFIHRLADIVVTGHEHQSNSRLSDDAASGECAYIEGAALQQREDKNLSGFNIVVMDIPGKQFR